MGHGERGAAAHGAVAVTEQPPGGAAARTTGAAGDADRTLYERVRDALAHLHDVPYLQVHPLAAWLSTGGSVGAPSAAAALPPRRGPSAGGAGGRLQARLIDAVAALDPSRPGRPASELP